MLFKTIVASLVVSLFLWSVWLGLAKFEVRPFLTTRIKEQNVIPKMKILGWIPYWDQPAAFTSFSSNVALFDSVGFFWYRLTRDGRVEKYNKTILDRNVIDLAQRNKVKVLAVIANLPDEDEKGEWDPQRVDKVIESVTAREKHIADIINLLASQNFDGINIDYEALKFSQRENFSLFIEELAKQLHQRSKTLGVAIHPKTSEFNPDEDNGSSAQDLGRLGRAADHLYFMTYTEHSISSDPGPLGSVDWVRQVVSYAINKNGVDPKKIYLGIGLFGLTWGEKDQGWFMGEHDDLTFQEIQALLEENPGQIVGGDKSKSSSFEYKKNGRKYIVWFERIEDIKAKIKIAQELNVGGLAFWRLGGEDPQLWEVLSELN